MAIAFDNATNGGTVFTGLNLSFSHTCSGSDRILYVVAFGDTVHDDNTGNKMTGTIYGSDLMTELARLPENNGANPTTDRWCYLFELVAPASGSNTVLVVCAAGAVGAVASSYTGAAQTGQPDAQGSNYGSGTTATDSTTVGTASSWIVAAMKENQGWTVTPTNGIERVASAANGLHLIDSNGTVSTGANTIGGTGSPSAEWVVLSASFKPVSAGGFFGRTYYDQIPQGILNV